MWAEMQTSLFGILAACSAVTQGLLAASAESGKSRKRSGMAKRARMMRELTRQSSAGLVERKVTEVSSTGLGIYCFYECF